MSIGYNPFSLNGKTILVTGASSGIGQSIAIECSKLGAKIILTARNHNRLNNTYSMMHGTGHLIISADITCERQIIALVDQLPLLNGVVHSVGIGSKILAKFIKESDINMIMDVNVKGPMLLQKHLLKQKKILKESSIIFIASTAPFSPYVGNSIYSASKGAILGYAKCLALELANQFIRVNSILPAMVWTEFALKDEQVMGENYSQLKQEYLLKRFGKPEDIAYLAIYLLSDASSWMTGSCIAITGGEK